MTTAITVSTLSELYEALAAVQGGEVIELAGGDYGTFELGFRSPFNLDFPDTVTIRSADLDNPAVFSGMNVRYTSNLTLDGLTFDYSFSSEDRLNERPFSIADSHNITVKNSIFDGDLAQGQSVVDDGFGYAIGLWVRDSADIAVEDNTFFDFHKGAAFAQVDDLAVTGNELTALRSDGLNFVEIQRGLIEGNLIHNFKGSDGSNDHRDMIQFWSGGTDQPSTDIIIRGNHLDIGSGSATQSIFMRNEAVDQGGSDDMFYQNILIEQNVIVNAHSHGITVGETDGLTIRQNTILHADGEDVDGADPKLEIPRINLAERSVNVTVTQNITAEIAGDEGQNAWQIGNNALVQDQNLDLPGYYSDVFVTSSIGLVEGLHQFRAAEGGLADQLAAGADATYAPAPMQDVSVHFDVQTDPENAAVRHFDAGASTLDGAALPEGTMYIWAFENGVTRVGQQISHAFSDGGDHDVHLRVILPDGSSAGRTVSVEVVGPKVVTFDPASGLIHHDRGSEVSLEVVGLDADAQHIVLGDADAIPTIDRSYVDTIVHQEEFRISMDLTAADTDSAGEVARLHGSFIVTAQNDGRVQVQVFQEDGTQLRLFSQSRDLNDTQTHRIEIALKDGLLQLVVDGEVEASTAMTGSMATYGRHDMTFYNVFKSQNFEGTLSALEITVNESAYEEAAEFIYDLDTWDPSQIWLAEEVFGAPETVVDTDALLPLSNETDGQLFLDGELRLGLSSWVDDGPAASDPSEEAALIGVIDSFIA